MNTIAIGVIGIALILLAYQNDKLRKKMKGVKKENERR